MYKVKVTLPTGEAIEIDVRFDGEMYLKFKDGHVVISQSVCFAEPIKPIKKTRKK